ncbi:hypothetical protein EAI_09567 [Harpegnathos saltator]|uniref:Structure-specific endonuclease subunit SLX4 n=2 Tax=Harpegnathos saltator TaxID=610380 RepID=E2BQ49_HARSA|nr:hypothetical protein EAI_09567 [Harpegnathos saltator]
MPNHNVFYVTQLSPYITPLSKEEYKLNVEKQNIIEDQSDKESITKYLLEIKEVQSVDVITDDEELTMFSNVAKTCCEERRFLDKLAVDWKNILNDSSASDIIVLVKNSRHIWAHKLVFYVRCTNILLDVMSNDTEFSTAKEKICWIDIDYDVALAFLEFVYCGTIKRHLKVLDSDTSLLGIRSLARKYKINDLFVYLRQKKCISNLTEQNRTGHKKNTENVIKNVEEILTVSEPGKLTCNISPNYVRDDLKEAQCIKRTLLQEDTNNISQFLGNDCTLVKSSCILEDQDAVSTKSLEQINSSSNTPTNRSTTVSPDIFDDTPEIKKHNDKSATHSRGHEDSDIRMLLSLIKQDADISICSQKLSTRKTDDAKYPESDGDISICLGQTNEKQNIMEIDSDSDLNFPKPSVNSLMDTPQSSKSNISQGHSSDVVRQKSNLTLFIEKIQRENAKSDSDLDFDLDITSKIPRLRHSNLFRIHKSIDTDNEDPESDNLKQTNKTKKKLGKLSIIEQRMRSFASKNPEFYSISSGEDVSNVKQNNALSAEETTESSHDDPKNYSRNFISTKENVNILNQVTITPLPTVHSPDTKTNQPFNKNICDLEEDEEDISMYSKYMRNHHDNSIAKYRPGIERNISDGNLSDASTVCDISIEDSDINENDTILTRSFLTQKDACINASSDTEIENISSSVNCPIIPHIHNDNFNHEDNVQLSEITTKNNKQDIIDRKTNQSFVLQKNERLIALDLEKQEDITINSDQTEFNINDKNMTSDNEDIELDVIFTQTESGLNKSNKDKIDSHKEESISSPITVSSSPDLQYTEGFSDKEIPDEHVSEVNNHELEKSTGSSNFVDEINFEADIHLANVDVDKYEKHILEESKSVSVLNATKFRKSNSRRSSNESNSKNIIDNYKINSGIIRRKSSVYNAISLTQNSTSIRKLKRKSLSEGQININRLQLANQEDTSKHASVQFQHNYKNIENIKAVAKIIDKDVTPPPDYDAMRTPEIHKEMKKYGLKVQKRNRAVKLLKYIYNELHPLIPIHEASAEQEISSDEESPPAKKPNTNDSSEGILNNAEESYDELTCSQDSNESANSVKNTISKEMEFYETESLPTLENSSDIKEAFTKLINIDKDLYNKILRYEPINIEQLHATLRLHGFKCKLSNFMNFLDEQCITFYMPEQSVKNRAHRKA